MNLQSVWEDDEVHTSVVSTTHKSQSMKSVGASYYSYLTSIERQLKDERDARKALEDEINKLKRKNEEICEFYKPKSQMS